MIKVDAIVLSTTGLLVLAACAPAGSLLYKEKSDVNVEAMLDVSISIKTISHVHTDAVGDSVWNSTSGSGVLISSDTCEVWTNHHVIEDAAVVEVRPRGWTAAFGIPATVVNATPRSDIAILRMQSCEGIPEATLGDSDAVRPGDEAFAVGNPLGRNPDSISRGIISNTERYVAGPTRYLQTDATIHQGNSGGALFNRAGEVIGINAAIAADHGKPSVGISYAIPGNFVQAEVRRLRQGPPSWGDAGINDIMSSLTSDEAEIFGVPKDYCAISISKTPTQGSSAGKLFERDVVFKVDNEKISGVAQARRVISSHDAGETITFHLVRAGKVTSVDITLSEGWKTDKEQPPEYYEGHLGMTLEMWHEEDGENGKFDSPVITKVHNLGPAHKGHIMSSQKNVAMRGSFLMPYQLDVKTVTGVVLRGEYHAVTNLEDLSRFAGIAFETGIPLLLEIEMWSRSDPRAVGEPLEPLGKAFYKITPERTIASAPMPDEPIEQSAQHYVDSGGA